MEPTDFHQMGIAVIPVLPKSKKPAVGNWRQYQKRLPPDNLVQAWFRPGRETNAAVICGWRGLTVLDFDDATAYVAWQSWAVSEGGIARQVALETYRVKSSRGMHLYLFVDNTPRCEKSQYCDIKGKGGYVLIPPSVHPSGARYVAVEPFAPILKVSDLAEVIPDPPEPPVPPINPPTRVYQTSNLWPMTVIEQIKTSYSILDFFPTARPTGGNGRWYMTHCPFHDDRNESMRLDTQHNLAFCFAGCTPKPLDVIALYARLNNLTNREAVKVLAARVV